LGKRTHSLILMGRDKICNSRDTGQPHRRSETGRGLPQVLDNRMNTGGS
jgi:hypothetical protein